MPRKKPEYTEFVPTRWKPSEMLELKRRAERDGFRTLVEYIRFRCVGARR